MANTRLKFYRGALAPANPTPGTIWFNTTLNLVEIYTGAESWEKYGNVQDVTFNELKLNVKKADGTEFTLDFSDVASATGTEVKFTQLAERLAGIDQAITDNTSAINDVDDKVDALDAKIGFTPAGENTTVIKYVDAKVAEAASGANGELAEAVEELEGTINALDKKIDDEIARADAAEKVNAQAISDQKARIDKLYAGSIEVDGETIPDENKSVREIAAEEVALIVDGASESYDTLKEISDWIAAHPTDASEYNSRITKNTDDIAALTKTVGDNKTAADQAIEALQGRATTLETFQTNATSRLDELEAHDEDYKGYTDAAIEGLDSSYKAETTAEGKIAVVTGIEIENGKIVTGEGKATGKIDVYTVAKIDELFNAATGDGGSIATQIANALDPLDFAGAEVVPDKNGVSVIANVSQENGKVSATAVEVEAAGAAAKALEDAKLYAEQLVEDKNVEAEGDNYVAANAADNKVTVSANVNAIREYVLTWEDFGLNA